MNKKVVDISMLSILITIFFVFIGLIRLFFFMVLSPWLTLWRGFPFYVFVFFIFIAVLVVTGLSLIIIYGFLRLKKWALSSMFFLQFTYLILSLIFFAILTTAELGAILEIVDMVFLLLVSGLPIVNLNNLNHTEIKRVFGYENRQKTTRK